MIKILFLLLIAHDVCFGLPCVSVIADYTRGRRIISPAKPSVLKNTGSENYPFSVNANFFKPVLKIYGSRDLFAMAEPLAQSASSGDMVFKTPDGLEIKYCEKEDKILFTRNNELILVYAIGDSAFVSDRYPVHYNQDVRSSRVLFERLSGRTGPFNLHISFAGNGRMTRGARFAPENLAKHFEKHRWDPMFEGVESAAEYEGRAIAFMNSEGPWQLSLSREFTDRLGRTMLDVKFDLKTHEFLSVGHNTTHQHRSGPQIATYYRASSLHKLFNEAFMSDKEMMAAQTFEAADAGR